MYRVGPDPAIVVSYQNGRCIKDVPDPNVSSEVIEDLKRLAGSVSLDKFKTDNKCYLNPTFGNGSSLVGGADADLIIDDTLIDIKTTKNMAFTQDILNQVIGYYALSKIGKINDIDDVKIDKIGCYYPYFDYLYIMGIDTLAEFDGFVAEFEMILRDG